MLKQYFMSNGYLSNIGKEDIFFKLSFSKEDKYTHFLDFINIDLKKNKMCFYVLNNILEIYKGIKGANVIIKFQFFKNNFRVIVYIETYGFILYSSTGGIVAKKVLRAKRVYKRDKKGDGTLNYIGRKLKKKIHKVLKHYRISDLKMYLSTYFRRYMFFKLIKPYVFKRLKSNVFLRIPKGHNSLESEKRWRKRRR